MTTKKRKNQIKCPLRRRLKIARELASLILLGSELKAKRPEFLKFLKRLMVNGLV